MSALALTGEHRTRPGAPARVSGPRRRVGPLFMLGFVVLQLGWLLAMPPFSGTDEVDQAYRAAGVAAGQVVAPATDQAYGTGALVTVPRDIVTAAGPQCRALTYTKPINCDLPARADEGLVSMPSSAGRYSPAYYALVGVAGLPFQGNGALYAMRAASMVLCTAFLMLAVWCLGCIARGPLPYVALIVGTTPMIAYSTLVVAPNGLEIMAATALWCALLALTSTVDPAPLTLLAAAGVCAACVLAIVRPLGPLWLVLIVTVVVLARPPRQARALLRRCLHSSRFLAASALVAVTAIAGLAWTFGADALDVAHDGSGNASWSQRLSPVASLPLWVLQSVAAVPSRGNASPPAVYVCSLAAFGTLLVLAWRTAGRFGRQAIGAVAALGLAIPLVISAGTISTYGVAWQGRYTLPLTIGLPLLGGVLLDSSRRSLSTRWLVVWIALPVVAQVVSVLSLLQWQTLRSPLRGDPAWLTAPEWGVGAVALVGAGAMALAVVRGSSVRPARPSLSS